MPENIDHPESSLTVGRTILADLLVHAAAAAHLVGHLDEVITADRLGDHVDAIVHGLTELLGDPHAFAAPDAAAPDDRAAHDRASMLGASSGGAP